MGNAIFELNTLIACPLKCLEFSEDKNMGRRETEYTSWLSTNLITMNF